MVSRESNSMAEAIVSAVVDIHRAGFEVIGVSAQDLVTLAEAGRRVGRTRESMRLLALGKRGPGGFPMAVSHGTTPLYSWSQVQTWLNSHGYDTPQRDPDHDALVAADLLIRARKLLPEASPLRLLVSAGSSS